ncbi:MAG: putative O-glycosylation ligase, exosortase A system-associated, partial [Thermomicrobiales bacterium]
YIFCTTLVALVPDRAWPMLERAVKVQIGTLLALIVLYRRDHVIALIWVLATSIGFYAIKGGVFTIITLGEYRVWGPVDSFIEDNNAFGLATVMSIPLWAYLYTQSKQRPWIRFGILTAALLSAVSVAGSHSRGAIVAIIAMAMFLLLKTKRKMALGIVIAIAVAGAIEFMPKHWEERISTITDPRAEASANSRLETWTMLWNLAVDRPLTGGGFEAYSKWIFQKYNPTYDRTHAAHSIYFQVLGEHGFVALALFLFFWALVWRMCRQVATMSRGRPDDQWAYWLAQMVKVSIVAYLVGGAFQNLAYWDMPYYLFVAIAVTRCSLKTALAAEWQQKANGSTANASAIGIVRASPAR